MLRSRFAGAAMAACALLAASCGGEQRPRRPAEPAAPRPSILLVTLDTTRADVVGPDAKGVTTPAFNAVAARGRVFRQAYATVPETLPSHASMLTGLYPAGHGVHENGRTLPAGHALAPARLREAGYRTAAFVSSYILAKRFGLARGFDTYDDEMPAGRAERTAAQVTDAAVAYLERDARAGGADPGRPPVFLWVHYFDPHAPYQPPEPFAARFAGTPYLGEVAAMDAGLGRLVRAFETHAPGPTAVIVVGDHGEGLGEHGEALHGNLLYQSTVHVPLVVSGPGIAAGPSDAPVSIRRVFHTILDLGGLDAAHSLRGAEPEIVLGEAMKPFLNYGWQPQTMAVEGAHKSILAGRLEMYDVVRDPAESRDLADEPGRPLVPARLRDYPAPSPGAARPPESLDADARRTLASLGYVGAGSAPIVRKDAPRPADMVRLFGELERASDLFVQGEYKAVIPVLERILKGDAFNLDATLRLATSYSATGQDRRAVETFKRAAALAPESADVRLYLGLHYAKGRDWAQAAPLLEQAVADFPDRVPALEGLAAVRERQGRFDEAIALRQQVFGLRDPAPAELARLGELAMSRGNTPVAVDAFERARAAAPESFAHDLELGVLYMDARRFTEARAAFDRVPASHPRRAMALFKRAQVSVLLGEPDAAARIAAARRGASPETRALIARETLFAGIR